MNRFLLCLLAAAAALSSGLAAQGASGVSTLDEDTREAIEGILREIELGARAVELVPPGEVYSLARVLLLTMDNNKDIEQARLRLEQVAGLGTEVRSRLLPQIAGEYGYTWGDIESDNATLGENETSRATVSLSQRLLEFGRDHTDDVNLRAQRRNALLGANGYEQTVRNLLYEVRREFFTVLVHEQQLAMREQYLQDFLENEQEALMRYRKEITRVDPVLTAHVTVLRQRLALTRLRRDQFNRKMNLLRLMGEPIGTSVDFAGGLEGFDLALDDAVGIAFDNSIELALSREELAEQVRSVREVWWEFAPDVAGEVRWGDGDTEAAIVLDEDGSETWALDAETDQIVSRSNDSTTGFQPDEEDWEASVTVTLPLFEGLRRAGTLHRERAALAERRVAYSSSEDSLELSVRQAYQSLEEARMSLEIERQALAASREILRIKEYQNSAEKITDDELETYRSQFFDAQDRFFSAQDTLIDAQENVRRVIGYYE